MADGAQIIQGLFKSHPRSLDAHPQSNVGSHGYPAPEPLAREPEPVFEVDRRNGCVVWAANGLRLIHPSQFRALSAIFAENGWRRHFLALDDAELALSDVPPDAA